MGAKTKIIERIDSLEDRLKNLKARRQRIEARERTVENRRTRREETRRKILVGAIVLAKVDQEVLAESTLRSWLDKALTRSDDRALFGLDARR
jgi:septal ring factor EnvC (AmiA/AmiB activator)